LLASQSVSITTDTRSLISLLALKIVHFVDTTDMFTVSNLVHGGRKIVTNLYSSLEGERLYGGYSELAGSLFVSVKIKGLEDFLEQLTL